MKEVLATLEDAEGRESGFWVYASDLWTVHEPICYNEPAVQPKYGLSTAIVTTN